jgi:hypothetical protein
VIRNILAVVVGLFVGSCVNMALIMLNTSVLYPMAPGTDMNDPAAMNAYVATLPAAAFLVVMAAHLGQSFVGGWVAARLGASRPMLLAMIVGGFSLLGGILSMMSIKGPTWFYVELPLYLVVAWAAGRLEAKRRQKV